MQTPTPYSDKLPLEEKIMYVLHHFNGANTQDIVSQITELDGIAAEEAVARLHGEVENGLEQLEEKGRIERLNVHGRRYRALATF